jgi:hypothetical protein
MRVWGESCSEQAGAMACESDSATNEPEERQSPQQTPNLLVLLENAWTPTQFFHEELVGR